MSASAGEGAGAVVGVSSAGATTLASRASMHAARGSARRQTARRDIGAPFCTARAMPRVTAQGSGSARSIRSVPRRGSQSGRPDPPLLLTIEMSVPGPAAAAPRARFVPCLRLGTETIFVDRGRATEEIRAAAMKLAFDYGAGARGPRDPRGEAEARRVLEALGAIELDALDDCAVAPGADVDYVLRLDGDVHALCAFSAYAIPQLVRLGWKVDVDPEYPWQVVDAAAPLYADVAPDEKRPDWFGLELGVEIDGCRVDLLPAMLDLLEQTPSLDALGRLPRKCIAVRVDARRWLPVPPERLKLLLQVLRELYRGGARTLLPARSAVQLAHLGAALHGAGRAVRWTGDRSLRDTGYALALGPRAAAVAAAPPLGLQAELRPYQAEGVAWLAHLRAHDA